VDFFAATIRVLTCATPGGSFSVRLPGPTLGQWMFCLLLCCGGALTGRAQSQAQFLKADATTQGTWKNTYGASGFQLINETLALPATAQLTAAGQASHTWQATTTQVRALQKAATADRLAATWFTPANMSLTLQASDSQYQQVALYFLDWDAQGRQQRVDVLDAQSGALLDSRTLSNFSQGVYLVWRTRGAVQFKLTRLAGPNAVVSGLFLNAELTIPGRALPPSASFVKTDTATRGAWKTVYGAEGRHVINDVSNYPRYAQVTPREQNVWAWANASSDVRALQRVQSPGQLAAAWYASKDLSLEMNLTDGRLHTVALYFLDWDNRSRSLKVELLNGLNGAVLDTRAVNGFYGGQYLVWQVGGRVTVRITRVGGDNAVLSGIFFGLGTGTSTGAPPVITTTPPPSPTPNADTTAPVLSAISSGQLSSTSATIAWTTNEPGTSKIEYGPTPAYGNQTTRTPLVTNHQIGLLGLTPQTLYHYRVLSQDAAGNLAQSGDLTFSTAPADAAQTTANQPELPRVYLDTNFTPPAGRMLTVNAGEDLQAAFNAAVPGDTIVLAAGASFLAPSGGYVLPAKANPQNQWIVVRTSTAGGLPAAGTRVNPSYAAAMPKILSRDTTPALVTAAGANYWRLLGLEISLKPDAFADATTAGAPINYGLLALGSHAERNAANLATDLIVDRCYIHGQPRKNVRRGITLNSRRTAIIDSYFAEIHEVGSDSQAIGGWNGPGPYKIVNNYLEAAGENILLGGADPVIANLVPADLEIRRNHFFKPRSWRIGDPSYAGVPWSVKNLFELKNAQRVLIDGNVFENNWLHSQNGFAILFTVANQDGGAPWTTVSDITFSNNLVRHAGGGVNVLGRDYRHGSVQLQRLQINNNVFDDLNPAPWGGTGHFLQVTDSIDLQVEHNTIFHTGNLGTGYPGQSQPANTRFVFRNNLAAHNAYGFIGDSAGVGHNTLNQYFPNCIFTGNILAGGSAGLYPAGNYFPANLDAVGFVNRAGGDYRLAAGSPYKNKGSDGRDPGADIPVLNTVLSGVVQ
jgi:hypothetical protein